MRVPAMIIFNIPANDLFIIYITDRGSITKLNEVLKL
jgi:hypothetical protein